MKSALNGGLQLSVLDGWWAEAYDGTHGWAIPADPSGDNARDDMRDANVLFDLLESQVVPLFYERDAAGVPLGWLRQVKASIAAIGTRFTAATMLQNYAERYRQVLAGRD